MLKDDELIESETLSVRETRGLKLIALHEGSLKHVYSVDASGIMLGECENGVVISARGVIIHGDQLYDDLREVWGT